MDKIPLQPTPHFPPPHTQKATCVNRKGIERWRFLLLCPEKEKQCLKNVFVNRNVKGFLLINKVLWPLESLVF